MREFFASQDLREFIPHGCFRIHPLSAAINYSHSIFEGMSLLKVNGSLYLFHPYLNLERMRYNAEEVGLEMDSFTDQAIVSNIFALAAINGFHRPGHRRPTIRRAGKSINRFYVRPLLYAESESVGLGAGYRSRLLITLTPTGEYLRYDRARGLDTMLYPFPRNLPMPGIKTSGNYQIGIVSRRKMEQFNLLNNETCAETVFFNSKGHIIEGSGENVVLLRDDTLISPPPSEGAIPGITLRLVSSIARELGLKFRFGVFGCDELEKDDSLFLTGNAAGIVPVSSVCKVDEKFRLERRLSFGTSSDRRVDEIISEYQKMETAEGEYERFHLRMDDFISTAEAERIYSYASRMHKRMVRMPRSRSIACPSEEERVVHGRDSLVRNFGMKNFYPPG